MKKIQTVKIEKLSNSGEGIARINNYVIFVENAIPEDIVEIEITKENKNFAKAKILKIKHPSSGRIKPFCALYNACGACSLQHANYDFQLKLKREITADAMKNIGNIDTKIEDIEPSPETKEFRCKIQYPIGQTKISKRFLAGYYKPKSHDIVNIKFCPIQPRICDEIIEFIRKKAQEYNLTCYNEKTGKGLLRHVVIRHSNYSKENLVTFVINANKISNTIKKFAQEIYNHFETITGVCANFNTIQNNVIMGAETQIICGNSVIEEKILDKTFKIGANTFFQINCS